MAEKGGRIPPDGRPPQAKGVGANAKRHDLERPATPGLHDSDLQQGDVQAMEQGQRIAPRTTQQPASGAPAPAPALTRSAPVTRTASAGVQPPPDAIDFLAGKNGSGFNLPRPVRQMDQSKAVTWLPILRRLVSGPGASPALVSAFINQARKMQQRGSQPATIMDMNAADDGIEAMLDAGIR